MHTLRRERKTTSMPCTVPVSEKLDSTIAPHWIHPPPQDAHAYSIYSITNHQYVRMIKIQSTVIL